MASSLACLLPISVCRSTATQAASQGGGALLVEQSYGRVALALTEFDRNVAQRRGGGLMTTSTRFVDVANCSLSGNVAVLGQGGGWWVVGETLGKRKRRQRRSYV